MDIGQSTRVRVHYDFPVGASALPDERVQSLVRSMERQGLAPGAVQLNPPGSWTGQHGTTVDVMLSGMGPREAISRTTAATRIAATELGLETRFAQPDQLVAEIAGMSVVEVEASADWADIRSDDGNQCLSFQQVQNYTPPAWPSRNVPQQMHLDVIVDDLDAAERAVLQLGATKHEHQPGDSFRVFLDPAGHPFCLCIN